MIGDFGEAFLDVPSSPFIYGETSFPCPFGEFSMMIAILVDVCGLPCLNLVLLLVFKYMGVCFNLFPVDYMGVLMAVKACIFLCGFMRCYAPIPIGVIYHD